MPSSHRFQDTNALAQRSEQSLDYLCQNLEREEARESDLGPRPSALAARRQLHEHQNTPETPSWGRPICTGTQTEDRSYSSYDLELGVSTSEISREEQDYDLLSHISDKETAEDNEFMKATSAESRQTQEQKSTTADSDRVYSDDQFQRQNSVKPQEEKQEDKKDKPTLGMAYYILHTVLLSGNMYAAQQLFKSADTVAVMQLTFLRGVVCSLMVLLMINVNIKSTLYDPVNCKALPSLIFRCLQGGISVYIAFSSVNYFNVSTVGIVCSLKPIIACVFGVAILGEKLGFKDVICMSAVFIAVFLVIFGSQDSQQASMQTKPLAMVMLVAQPFLLAGGDIAMRQMRKMPEQLCSAYQNLTLTALASIYMLATGLHFDFIYSLSGEAWLYLICSCSLTIFTQLAKARAFSLSPSAPLQKLSFLPNVWQFSIDLLILSVAFSCMQLIGFALLVLFYLCEMTYSIVERRMANKKEFACNDEGYTRL